MNHVVKLWFVWSSCGERVGKRIDLLWSAPTVQHQSFVLPRGNWAVSVASEGTGKHDFSRLYPSGCCADDGAPQFIGICTFLQSCFQKCEKRVVVKDSFYAALSPNVENEHPIRL